MKHPLRLTTLATAALSLCLTASAQQPPKPSAASKQDAVARPASAKNQKPAAIVPTVITVRSVAMEVPNATFKLGDIADVKTSDAMLATRLTAVEIGAAPLPGLSRPLYEGDIVVKLRGAGFREMFLRGQIVLSMPPNVRVTRAKNEIGGSALVDAAIDAAREETGGREGITFEAGQEVGPRQVPQGKIRLLAGAIEGRLEQGRITVPVSIMVDGSIDRTVSISLKVRRKFKVVTAARSLDQGIVLSETDLTTDTLELPPGLPAPATDLKAAIGKRLRRRIAADEPIPANALETPPAILANASVTVEYVIGSLRIRARGTARQAGAAGDRIHVGLSDTKKEIEAVVISGDLVRITEQED